MTKRDVTLFVSYARANKVLAAKLLARFREQVAASKRYRYRFWHEWRLFGLPGGIQLFLVLNLALFAVALVGLRQLILWKAGARLFSYFLAACGVFAFSIHMWFIAAGHPEFRSPVSVTILAATLVLSLVQLAVTARLK